MKKDTIKWIVIFVLVIGLVGAVIGLSLKLSRGITDERLGAESYSIGTITDEGEIDKTDKTSIYTRDLITYSDITDIIVRGEVDYAIAYYDKDGKFITKEDYTLGFGTGFMSIESPDLSEANIYSCRIIIIPRGIEEIKLTEISKYSKMLEVRIKK